jgi:3-hydroxybutyrate dehydrogenase
MIQAADAASGTEVSPTLTKPVVQLDLTGRAAVVTGGASGIGLACARVLSEAGADVTMLDLNAEAADAVAAESGGRAIVSDLSDPEALDELSVSAVVVVNNAAFKWPHPCRSFRLTVLGRCSVSWSRLLFG